MPSKMLSLCCCHIANTHPYGGTYHALLVVGARSGSAGCTEARYSGGHCNHGGMLDFVGMCLEAVGVRSTHEFAGI